ncbi:MAG TPA: MASE1 domain-containing protein, partial [Candidatus Cybelea sp.]|nr:MASE1 domain-containing protein [Candidatus Cybelea sp.]
MKISRDRILIPLFVAIAYVVGAKLGFQFAFATKEVTAVWPPTGIALAALLLWGYRAWPGIFVGALASNAIMAEPLWTAAMIATGNTLAPVFGCFLLRLFKFENSLDRVRDVLLLTLFGAAIAMTVSATNGVAALALARIVSWHAFGSVWWVWWAGDAMGVLFIAPPLLTWIAGAARKERPEGSLLEFAALGTILVIAGVVSFLSDFPLRFSVYPLVIWAALRFTQRETTATIAILSGLAIWATAHGLGPWNTGSLDTRLLQLDSWMSVLVITGLVLGAAAAEARTARIDQQTLLNETKRSAELLQEAFLPEQLPQRPGLRCDALYTAAEREDVIGGDWYDIIELPDGRIAFVLGDVTGHGLDAAVAASRIRRSILVATFETGDPAEILSKAESTPPADQHAPATAIVAIISSDLSSISYASAGHPPPIAATPETAPHFLQTGGLPLGFPMPGTRETHTQALEPSTTLVFYTDGLTEFNR